GEMSQDPTPEHEALSKQAKPDYEPPSVEEVDTEDAPAVTAAGTITGDDVVESDMRLKRSLRPLEGATTRLR
ncbi:MAG: hypothetical protein ACRDL6_06395, partial [Solirubrobacterales bacterium]